MTEKEIEKGLEYYSLMCVDGNHNAIMEYVSKCMKKEGRSDEDIKKYRAEAMSSDYSYLVNISANMITELNIKIIWEHIKINN